MSSLSGHCEQIFDDMPEVIFVLDRDGGIAYANRRAVDFYGYPRETLENMTVFELARTDDPDFIRAKLSEAALRSIEVETRHVRADGAILPMLVRTMPANFGDERNADGCGSIVSIVHDFSGMERLEGRSQMFDLSLDLTQDAVIVVDADFRVVLWNRTAEEWTGYAEAEAIGRDVGFLVPEDRQEEHAIIQDALRSGKAVRRMETVRIAREGRRFDVEVSFSPRYSRERKLTGYVKIYRDITERKRGERLLREHCRRVELALAGGSVGIWELDFVNCGLIFHNSPERALGRKTGELGNHLGRWLALIPDADRPMIRKAIADRNPQDGSFVFETRMRGESGEFRWMRVKGRVLESGADGEPMRAIGTLDDFTDRKRMELELERKNRELEILTAEARRANEAKSLFLANISHEIRTPLHGILSATQLLEQLQGCRDSRELLQIIKLSSNTLNGVVNELLDVARQDREEPVLGSERFRLRELISEIALEMRTVADQTGLDAECVVDPAIPDEVTGDVERVRQILSILVSNALKFTHAGHVALFVRLSEGRHGRSTVEFEVRDTGIGISEAFAPHVFEKFSQEDSSFTRKYGGAGLGLSIARHQATLIGGGIRFESIKGKGSRFFFRWPLGM